MAVADIEVEIRLSVSPQQFQNVRKILETTASFKNNSEELDEYFTPPHRNFVALTHPFEWLRIREKAGNTSLNYKHFHPENVAVTTHCDEFETGINEPEKLRKIFAALNFNKLITVKKQRKTFFTTDFEIALDIVDGLGHFIEIEALKDFGGMHATRNKIHEFARSLSLDPTKEDQKGYPWLLLEKRGLRKP